MYCKFCGGKIAPNSTKCLSCGANIDLDDGGQSFFEDGELESWASESGGTRRKDLPRTEMLDVRTAPKAAQAPDILYAADAASADAKPAPARKGASARDDGGKKKKTVSEMLNLSNPNRLIAFCIAAALVIALLVAAIIAALSGGNETANEEIQSVQNNTVASEEAAVSVQNEAAEENKDEDLPASGEKIKVDGAEICIDKKSVEDCGTVFMKDNHCFVSLDRVLKEMGYKDKRIDKKFPERDIYEHKTSGKVIEVESGRNVVWVKNSGDEKTNTVSMGYDVFEEKGENYAPAADFFKKVLGCELKYDEEEKVLTITTNAEK